MFVKAQEITAPQIFYKNHSIALTLGNWARLHTSIYLPDTEQCWVLAMWPCCAQLHWHRAIRHCISNEMRYDHLPLAIPAPKRTHHTTHSSARDTVGDPDKFRECNVGLLPILISHSYPLTLTWIDDWSENSPCSVSGAPSSVPGHPTPRLPCVRKGTHQFHCF